jgi:hypothetical protein
LTADSNPRPTHAWPTRLAVWQTTLLVGVFLVAASFEAIVVPYRNWDALDIGSWSRTIAAGGFHDGIYDFQLHRPLFYVGQGLLWMGVGYHEAAGRLLSLSFTVLLGVCLWTLAGRLTRDAAARRIVRALALTVLLSSAVVAQYASAGLTDVPVAATASMTAVFLTSRLGRARVPLVALGAASAVLAKPSGLLALAGLALATTPFLWNSDKRRAAVLGLVGIALGILVALTYDIYEARRLGEGLSDFLSAGANWDYWRIRAASTRAPALLGAAWLGASVSLLVVHGLVFGIARAVGARLRLSLLLAAFVAIVWSLAGPMLADGELPRPLQDAPSLLLLAYLVLGACLVAAPYLESREDTVPRRTYAALLLWAAPSAVSWIAFRSDEPRLLSPAWPGLVLLAASSLTVVAITLMRRSPAVAGAAVAAFGILALTNLPAIDGLDRSSWRALLELGPNHWDRTSTEQYAWGPFYDEVTALRQTVRPGDRIVSEDGRLRYLFPGQIRIDYPKDCAELDGARAFVLLLDPPAKFVIRANGGTTSPRLWERCTAPPLRRISAHPGSYVVFRIGPAPAD